MQIKTSPRHRKCKYPKCSSILSMYNHEDFCNVHLRPMFWEDKVDGIPAKQVEDNIPKIQSANSFM
ncbi:MAG: hypothetical protein P9L90_03390 [Candidatus Aadella gelida]|nr:hypothetical protein [Candidatus Aadella gelida]